MLASQRSEIDDHHNIGAFILPRIDRNRFIHVEQPSVSAAAQGNVERPSEESQVTSAEPGEDDDYDEAALPRFIDDGPGLPPLLLRHIDTNA